MTKKGTYFLAANGRAYVIDKKTGRSRFISTAAAAKLKKGKRTPTGRKKRAAPKKVSKPATPEMSEEEEFDEEEET